jgi:hypothetical protein
MATGCSLHTSVLLCGLSCGDSTVCPPALLVTCSAHTKSRHRLMRLLRQTEWVGAGQGAKTSTGLCIGLLWPCPPSLPASNTVAPVAVRAVPPHPGSEVMYALNHPPWAAVPRRCATQVICRGCRSRNSHLKAAVELLMLAQVLSTAEDSDTRVTLLPQTHSLTCCLPCHSSSPAMARAPDTATPAPSDLVTMR